MRFHSFVITALLAASTSALVIPRAAVNQRGLIGDVEHAILGIATELGPALTEELRAVIHLVPVEDVAKLLASGAVNIAKVVEQLLANASHLRRGLIFEDIPNLIKTVAAEKSLKRGLVGDLLDNLLDISVELPKDIYDELIAVAKLIPVEDLKNLLASGAENIIHTVGDILKNAQNLRKRGLVGDLVSTLLNLSKELPKDLYDELVAVAHLIPVEDLEKLAVSGTENIIQLVKDLIKNASNLRKRGLVGDLVDTLVNLSKELPKDLFDEFVAVAHLVPVEDLEKLAISGTENIVQIVKDLIKNASYLRKRGLVGDLVSTLLNLSKELPKDLYDELVAVAHLIPVEDLEKLAVSGTENIIELVKDLIKNASNLRKRGLVGDLVATLINLGKELPKDVYDELVAVAHLLPVEDLEKLLASGAENIIKTVSDILKNATQL